MDLRSFTHGQIQSKQWLCENLELFMPKNSNICILGSWYNVLGLMLLTRNHEDINFITGVDKDPEAIQIANAICQGWCIQPDVKIRNDLHDANTYNTNGFHIVINCSTEHMESTQWFSNIADNTLVCLQTSDVNTTDPIWDIKNHSANFEEFERKYPLKHYLMKSTKKFTYGDWGYNRFMLIGIK